MFCRNYLSNLTVNVKPSIGGPLVTKIMISIFTKTWTKIYVVSYKPGSIGIVYMYRCNPYASIIPCVIWVRHSVRIVASISALSPQTSATGFFFFGLFDGLHFCILNFIFVFQPFCVVSKLIRVCFGNFYFHPFILVITSDDKVWSSVFFKFNCCVWRI